MEPMTSIERISNIFKRKPVDRIGVTEAFWDDTKKKWAAEGHIKPNENLAVHFCHDTSAYHAFNLTADLDFKPEVIEEDEDSILTKDGNYAFFRRHKHHDTTPEHVDFMVKDRASWEEHIKPRLTPSRHRIDFEGYRNYKKFCTENDLFLMWYGAAAFDAMTPVLGHQYLLMGMAEDPDWIHDMVDTYATLTLALQETLFAEEGWPDGMLFYDDLGFKQRPFMSLAMYEEMIQPGQAKALSFAKANNKPIAFHSCGMMEAFVPGLIAAGVDCLNVIEVKAGMDLLKLYKNFGDRLSFMGGIDARVLSTNNRDTVLAELEKKVPEVMKNHGFVLQSDHSIPDTVEYDTYRYFMQEGLRLGTY